MSESKPVEAVAAKPAKAEAKKLPRPLPRPDIYAQTAPFWQAANEGRLLLQFCKDSGRAQWFPRSGSLYTGSRNIEWRESAGRGTVYSYTVSVAPWPGHEDRVPYICAYVELEEGVRMLANLFNVQPDEVKIGMPVKLLWERLSDKFQLPAFEPA